jgi:hydrogenase/urease accessory protein HupE
VIALRALSAVVISGLLALCSPVLAHPPGLSSAEVIVDPDGLRAIVTFALQDIEALLPLDSDLDAEVSPEELEEAKTKLAPLAARALKIVTDGREVRPSAPGRISYDDKNNLYFHLTFEGPARSRIRVHSTLLPSLPKGHRQFLSIKAAGGRVLGEKMLDAKEDFVTLALPGRGTPPSGTEEVKRNSADHPPNIFLAFLRLGVEHILTGYDHLLFLFALLVVAQGLWSSIKIITAFTVAHSLTLALATFNIVMIPGAIVEPLIAATIIYVGLENLLRRTPPKGRWWLTFLFGLVHGFGFARVLRELGVASDGMGVAVPLLSFNLGVELGQIAVAAILLPLMARMRTTPVFTRRWVPACSALVVLAGGYWLVERTWMS